VKSTYLIAGLAAAILLAGCSYTESSSTSVTRQESQTASDNQATLLAKEPVPVLADSIERANLIERAKFLNNTKFQSCIYLFSSSGALVSYYPVKRKPSSLNSYLLPGDKIVSDDFTNSSTRAGFRTAMRLARSPAYGGHMP